jgi:hypothetical protein
MSSRGVKYWPAPFGDSAALRASSPVDVPLHVRLHRRPLLGVDEVDDQPPQRGRVLDLLPRLLEDLPQHPHLPAQLLEDVPVVRLELLPVALEQARPVEPSRNDRLPVPRRPRLLVRHLEEEQKGDLLRLGHVREPVVTKNVREAPGLVDDLLCVGHGVGIGSCTGERRGAMCCLSSRASSGAPPGRARAICRLPVRLKRRCLGRVRWPLGRAHAIRRLPVRVSSGGLLGRVCERADAISSHPPLDKLSGPPERRVGEARATRGSRPLGAPPTRFADSRMPREPETHPEALQGGARAPEIPPLYLV